VLHVDVCDLLLLWSANKQAKVEEALQRLPRFKLFICVGHCVTVGMECDMAFL
jgi:hypothetical protein